MTTLATHRRELSYCATCPKLCRFSCPVSEVEAKETVTPWGKMTAAYEHLSRARPLDSSAAAATYACTGCMRCRTHCRHGNEVGLSLFAARAEAVKAKAAPSAVTDLARRFRQEAPLGPTLRECREDFGFDDSLEPAARAYVPGCSALSSASEAVADALHVARSARVPVRLDGIADLCCGYPLLAAGLEAEFVAAADRFIAAAGKRVELVVGDPGCAWTFLVAYPRFGRTVPFAVRLWVDAVAKNLASASQRQPLWLAVSYHDACYLGRGLGVYEAPRQVLSRAVVRFTEAFEKRDDGGCSGGGGLLPRTLKEAARGIAARQAAELGAPEKTIVTACPTAARMFRRAGAEALDLATVVRRWLRD